MEGEAIGQAGGLRNIPPARPKPHQFRPLITICQQQTPPHPPTPTRSTAPSSHEPSSKALSKAETDAMWTRPPVPEPPQPPSSDSENPQILPPPRPGLAYSRPAAGRTKHVLDLSAPPPPACTPRFFHGTILLQPTLSSPQIAPSGPDASHAAWLSPIIHDEMECSRVSKVVCLATGYVGAR